MHVLHEAMDAQSAADTLPEAEKGQPSRDDDAVMSDGDTPTEQAISVIYNPCNCMHAPHRTAVHCMHQLCMHACMQQLFLHACIPELGTPFALCAVAGSEVAAVRCRLWTGTRRALGRDNARGIIRS